MSASSTSSSSVASDFSSSGGMTSSTFAISGTSGCVAITAAGVGSADVASAGYFCGHTAAHSARQAANAAVVMIRFFMLLPPLQTRKEGVAK